MKLISHLNQNVRFIQAQALTSKALKTNNLGGFMGDNQCDGCKRGLAVKDKIHFEKDGKPYIGCSSSLYEKSHRPSDLEIVQKAVECSGGYLWLDSEGCWQIEGNTNIIGGGISSLLTWAKQTTGSGVTDNERFDLFDCHGEYVGNRDVESIVAQRDELLAKLEDESATFEGTVNLYKSLVKDLEEKLGAMGAELLAYKEAVESQKPVVWGAFYFGGEYRDQLHRFDSSEDQIDQYIAIFNGSKATTTLRKGRLYVELVPADSQ